MYRRFLPETLKLERVRLVSCIRTHNIGHLRVLTTWNAQNFTLTISNRLQGTVSFCCWIAIYNMLKSPIGGNQVFHAKRATRLCPKTAPASRNNQDRVHRPIFLAGLNKIQSSRLPNISGQHVWIFVQYIEQIRKWFVLLRQNKFINWCARYIASK